MKWLDKLERKYGKFGIPDLTIYIVICYVIGYVLQMFFKDKLAINMSSCLSINLSCKGITPLT